MQFASPLAMHFVFCEGLEVKKKNIKKLSVLRLVAMDGVTG